MGFRSHRMESCIILSRPGDAQKHHALQIWQTPYVGETFTPDTQTDSFLYKVGKQKDIVSWNV